jgi:anti-sigma regulatory factor (Ser/Thr protein kinase)
VGGTGRRGRDGSLAGSTDRRLRHCALFYYDLADYSLAIAEFLQAGAAAGERALVAVPGVKQERLRLALDQRPMSGQFSAAAFTDMSELGRNPARIMPAIQAFIDEAAGEPIRFVGEPIWPGRSAAEICEATRHEALINLAFWPASATILCPYDVAGLPDGVIADARRTHPVLISGGRSERSQAFAGPDGLPAGCDDPLPGVPTDATVAAYADDLRAVRTLVGDEACQAGLPRSRAVDLVLAVSEVAANTLRHTSAGGTVSLWRADGELICQLADTGHIADPLAGRRSPDKDHPGGQGLWLVNQVCDLVELRTGQDGTVVRLHMRLQAASASATSASRLRRSR